MTDDPTRNRLRRQYKLAIAVTTTLVAGYGCSAADESHRNVTQEARLHISGYRHLRLVSADEMKTKADFEKAMVARAQANEERRNGTRAPEVSPLDKLGREDLAEAFRGRSFAEGHEYEEMGPNYQVADMLIAARTQPSGERMPNPGGGHTNTGVPEELVGFTVHGTDTRSKIRNNRSYPYSPQGVLMTGCSGTMIGPSTMLTAAHCVHTGSGWIGLGQIHLGYDNADSDKQLVGPIGCYWVTIPSAYANGDTNVVYDYAVVDFYSVGKNNCFGEPGYTSGWLGVWAAQDQHLNDAPYFYVYGYPGDPCLGGSCNWPTIWGDGNNWKGTVGPQEIKHKVDTTGGQSGSGVYVIDSGDRYVIGVHYGELWNLWHGGYYNSGRRVDTGMLTTIEAWSSWQRDGSHVGHPWAP